MFTVKRATEQQRAQLPRELRGKPAFVCVEDNRVTGWCVYELADDAVLLRRAYYDDPADADMLDVCVNAALASLSSSVSRCVLAADCGEELRGYSRRRMGSAQSSALEQALAGGCGGCR